MARSSYRVKRWLRNVTDWRNYTIYQTIVGGKKASLPPIIFLISADNDIFPDDVTDAPEWFAEADFVLSLAGGVIINYEWVTDHWETTDDFPSSSGSGYIVQGAMTYPITFSGAEYDGNFITATGAVRITAAAGVYIVWSGN